jgi:hypothetical protein
VAFIIRIAGWKQQQHPVLYYAFHVGDQVLKVAGVAVQNSVEANRAIKMVSNLQVSLETYYYLLNVGVPLDFFFGLASVVSEESSFLFNARPNILIRPRQANVINSIDNDYTR